MPDTNAFAVERDEGVAVVIFDLPGEALNTLTSAVGEEFVGLLDRLAADATVGAIVLMSGKKDVFIAGADIAQFVALQSKEEAVRLSRAGQGFVNRIATSPKPLVAAIDGTCLGGGLELALAAHYRVAGDASTIRIGLPEVQLGILPGAGGTQRLPRLVGVRAALDMILTGRPLTPSRALRAGMVDEVVPRSILRQVATAAATRLAASWRPRRTGPAGLLARLLDRTPIGRRIVFWKARRDVMTRTRGLYPAPLAALEAVRHGLAHGMAAGLVREAELFGELATGPVSRRLVQLFFATTALKKEAAAGIDLTGARAVERLGVVGAGFMGSAIAGVAVLRAGVDVRLRDTDWERVGHGLAAARAVLGEARRRKRIDRHEYDRRRALLSGSPDAIGFGRRDLVIEAVFEDADVKRRTLADLETVVADTCVLATNTSTIPIARLQEGANRPERILGMHFFSPVQRMPLLEVIPGSATADWAVATAVRFGQRMGKTVIVVGDSPGFWVNRILAPYLNEAGWLLDEGVAPDALDAAMTSLGFPMGPLALLDEVGLDVAAKAAAVLHEAFGERLAAPPAIRTLIADGRLGRKAGRGFYRYHRGKKGAFDPSVRQLVPPRSTATPPAAADIGRRPLLALLNEAARAMSEGVVRHPGHGDIGAVMGFGFPPFLGGPLRYIDDQGAAAIVAELDRHAATIGPRFTPADVLVDMARSGRTFYQ